MLSYPLSGTGRPKRASTVGWLEELMTALERVLMACFVARPYSSTSADSWMARLVWEPVGRALGSFQLETCMASW